MVDHGSRAALDALITIYRRLLDRIEARNYDVLSERVSLSSLEKCYILVRSAIG